MASRAFLAAVVFSVVIPVLAQQPVYPSYPPPPPASGDNAPHTQPPNQTDQEYPDQAQPDQQGYPTNQTPQKPSPYPPDDAQSGAQTGQTQPYPQQSAPPEQPYPQQSGPAYPPPGGYLSWIPQGMGALARTAAFHTDFTFDRAMLQLAGGIWESSGDPEFAAAMSRLDGISVHSYHYAAPGMYDPRLLDGVRRQYTAMGWQHLVTTHSASRDGATDLWISFHNMRATGAVVLFQSPTNLNLIAFSGNLSPLDLLHLRGHFGIPRFQGDHFVPAPGPAARVTPPPPRY
jgi:hypothetical protein